MIMNFSWETMIIQSETTKFAIKLSFRWVTICGKWLELKVNLLQIVHLLEIAV